MSPTKYLVQIDRIYNSSYYFFTNQSQFQTSFKKYLLKIPNKKIFTRIELTSTIVLLIVVTSIFQFNLEIGSLV